MASDDTPTQLLALPNPCLLAVMQRCVSDNSSILSAATAHSRLQRAATEALRRLSAKLPYQARVDSLLLYLAKHGQHVHSLDLHTSDYRLQLLELPPSLTKLDSLQLEGMTLQLQPGLGGAQGVLRAEFTLTRLELSNCSLLDGAQGLAAALMQLPDLQHLIVGVLVERGRAAHIPPAVLSRLTKLTSLKLQEVDCQDSNSSRARGAALQPPQALTRLADLQLIRSVCDVTADSLSGADQLTRLVLFRQRFEPRALAGKAQLQHLTLEDWLRIEAGVTQLLSELQHLTQLTHLDLSDSCGWRGDVGGPIPPPAAYASLTASSKLQHLAFRDNTLPAAVWQYMCPPGRTLPQLTHLDISYVEEADGSLALPVTSALVSCCPGLQTLRISKCCSTAQLAHLQRLTGLHTLHVGSCFEEDCFEGVQVLCQLTGLQELDLVAHTLAESHILQLTQLTRLTALTARILWAPLLQPAGEPR
jgi:hypothetical protein